VKYIYIKIVLASDDFPRIFRRYYLTKLKGKEVKNILAEKQTS